LVGSPENVLRALAGEGQIEGIGAEVEVARPLKLTMRTELDLVEHARLVPRCEDTLTCEVRQVDLAFSTVLIAQPNSMARERPDFNRSDHIQVLPHHEEHVHLFA
jgi:hypothetical protein